MGGNLPAARACYEKVLRDDPRHAQALHLLGLVYTSTGRIEEGIALFKKCLVLEPRFAEAHSNLGNALLAQNKAREAIEAHQRALAISPGVAEIHCNLGNAFRADQKLKEAESAYQQALALKPDFAEAHNNLGNVFKIQGRWDEAVEFYENALRIRPNYADAHYNTGNVYLAREEWDKAVQAFQRALSFAPNHADARNNLGTAFKSLGRIKDAVAEYQRALALKPNFAEACTNFGNVLHIQNRFDEAISAHQRALTINPRYFEAWCNLGNAFTAQNRLDEAIEACDRALEIQPNSADVHYNRALALLTLGRLREGWPGYEARWECKPQRTRREFSQPKWNGERDLHGKSILLYAEQGLGDTLQFVRYVSLVAELGARVYLEVQAPLKELLSGIGHGTEVFARGEALPPFDLQCPLLSLPGAFQTDVLSLPAKVPYLWPSAEKKEKWKGRLSSEKALKVGIVWSGNAAHKNDHNRSIPFSLFKGLFREADARFFVVQKQVSDEEAHQLSGVSHVTNLASELGDFTDTAAILSNLDLLISVDTSVAHLAGGLGIKTWLLLPAAPDWRWLLARDDSPWYPSFRLYRQPKVNDWESVISHLADDLKQNCIIERD